MYTFVQVHVEEDVTNQILTITSKGMHMGTMLTTARETTDWTTDMEITCNQTQPWDDQGSPTNTKLEVAQLVYDNITIDLLDEDNPEGTVCFSKDGRYYSFTDALEFPFFESKINVLGVFGFANVMKMFWQSRIFFDILIKLRVVEEIGVDTMLTQAPFSSGCKHGTRKTSVCVTCA